MKADIITMHMINNYGSVLQTYATCKMFENEGYEAEVIDYYPERLKGYGSFSQLYRDAKPFHGNALKCMVVAAVNWPSYKLQNKVFEPFTQKYIPLSARYESTQEIKNNPPKADVYCTGSDQVWNNFLDSKKEFDLAYFLDFGNPKKRIAYSASFGRSDFTDEEVKSIGELLEKYDSISVREKSGIDVIERAGINDAECCLDPTFMVPKSTWTDMAEPINDKDYILVYKLHEDSIASEIALALAEKTGKKVIRISTALHRRISSGKTVMLPSVGEFLSYIMNASLVVTDSFHATALSINLNVPFVSVKWKMFNDRVESILSIAQLSERSVSSIEEAEKIYNKNIDFEKVNSLIDSEREKSEEFIKKALRGNN